MKTVLITGCSSGFGLETAQYFLDRDWQVIATMRTPREDVLPRSEHLHILPLDVTDPESIRQAVEAAGLIDVLVNNAGIGVLGALEGTSIITTREVFETNTLGTIAMTQAMLPQFRQRKVGVIVNITSSVTLMPLPLLSVYTASKAAINAFTESLALELQQFNVRVHLVLPGRAPETRFGENAQPRMLSSIPEANQKLLYEKALFNVVQNHPAQAKIEFQAALTASGSLIPATLQNFLTSYSTFDAAQGAENTYLEALLCKSLVDTQEYELAAALSKQVLTQKNDYRDVWMLLGYSQYKLEQYSDAEDAFKQAKKIDSLKPEVHYFLGSTLSEEAKYSDAIDELELALLYGFDPAEEAYKKIADGHEALEEWTDAVGAYEALLNLSPSTVTLFQKPIELCLDQLNDTDRALTLAQKATNLFPSTALSHALLAKVYLAQGKPELANTEVNTAFQIDSNFVLAHYLGGQVREAQNNPDGAKWEYKKTFELSSEDDPLHSQAAERYNSLLGGAESAAPGAN